MACKIQRSIGGKILGKQENDKIIVADCDTPVTNPCDPDPPLSVTMTWTDGDTNKTLFGQTWTNGETKVLCPGSYACYTEVEEWLDTTINPDIIIRARSDSYSIYPWYTRELEFFCAVVGSTLTESFGMDIRHVYFPTFTSSYSYGGPVGADASTYTPAKSTLQVVPTSMGAPVPAKMFGQVKSTNGTVVSWSRAGHESFWNTCGL